MSEYFMVALGGALGSFFRFIIHAKLAAKKNIGFPIWTFVINIAGATLFGVLTALDLGTIEKALLVNGVLGSFTTFSTFMHEGIELFTGGKRANVAVYIATTIILGLIGFITGYEICLLI